MPKFLVTVKDGSTAWALYEVDAPGPGTARERVQRALLLNPEVPTLYPDPNQGFWESARKEEIEAATYPELCTIFYEEFGADVEVLKLPDEGVPKLTI